MASRSCRPAARAASGGAAPRLERRGHLAARLVHHGERLPGVDGGPDDVPPIGQVEQVHRLALGLRQAAGEGVALRERGRAARLLVDQIDLAGALADAGEALLDLRPRRAGVVVAGARAHRPELALLVVHVFVHRADGRVSLARARVEAAVRLVEEHGAGEGDGLLDGERQRAVGHRHGLAERVGGERAPGRGLPVRGRLLVPGAEVEVLRHRRRVLAHRGEPPRGRGVQLLAQLLPGGRVGHVAHERVLEDVLPGLREARSGVLDEQLGRDQLAHRGLGLGDAERHDPGVPHAHPEDAGAHHRVAGRLLERVEADLDGRLDRRRRAHVATGGDDARQLFGEEGRAGGLLRHLIEHRVGGGGPDHRPCDLARRAPRDGPQLDAHVIAADEALALAAPERRAHQHHHEERPPVGAAEEVVDPGDGLGIRPLRVLDEHGAGLRGGGAEDELRHREPQRVARAAGVDALREGLVRQEAREQPPLLVVQLALRHRGLRLLARGPLR